jgi:formate/nitrite transporter FocA (FNT family)
VNPHYFGTLSFHLLLTAFVMTSWLIVYMINNEKKNRSVVKEVIAAFMASVFMSLGFIFAIMWGGIYL